MRPGMAAGADRLLGLGARAHHGAAGTEILPRQHRLRCVRIARDLAPLRGLAAPPARGPSHGIDPVFALAAKALEGDILDPGGASRDEHVAHDALVAGANRAPIHVVAELAARGGVLLELHQPRAVERRRRYQLFTRLPEPVLVRALPVALDLRLGSAHQENRSE